MMLRSQMCASSESENRKFSKTDYLDIAVYGGLRTDGNLLPIVLELLGKARELADQTGVKVSLVMIGNQISRNARDFFRFGADRIFIYDDPLYKNMNSDIARSIFDNFFENYKPSVMLFGENNGENDAVQSVFRQNEPACAYRQAIFSIRPNKDLDFSNSSQYAELVHISDFRPQLVSVPAGTFQPLIPNLSRRGELILCEQPSSLNHQEKTANIKKILDD